MGDLAVIQKCVRNMKSYDGPLVPPHPNVVFFEVQGKCKCEQQVEHPYSTISKLQKSSLKGYLERNSRIVLLQLAHALNHIHKNGWAHGNIKLENLYLSEGRVLLSHTTTIDHDRNATREKKAKDIADLGKVFSAILIMNRAENIIDADYLIAENLLKMMEEAPREASWKTIAKKLVNAIKSDSKMSTTKDSIEQGFCEVLENITGRHFRKNMKRDLKIICNHTEVQSGVVGDLFETMSHAWEGFVDSLLPPNISVPSDSTSAVIAQVIPVKRITENCKSGIAGQMFAIVQNAPEKSFKDSVKDGIDKMIDGIVKDYKDSTVKELDGIINSPDGTHRILQHPYFWDTDKKLNFLSKIAQFSKGDRGKCTKDELDAKSEDIFDKEGWFSKLKIDTMELEEYQLLYCERKGKKKTHYIGNSIIIKQIGGHDSNSNTVPLSGRENLKSGKIEGNKNRAQEEKKGQYCCDRLQSLLNFIRNRREHFWEGDLQVQACFRYDCTDGLWNFFGRPERFPKLFLAVYEIINERRKQWKETGIDKTYFLTIAENKDLPLLSAEDQKEQIAGIVKKEQSSMSETTMHLQQDAMPVEDMEIRDAMQVEEDMELG